VQGRVRKKFIRREKNTSKEQQNGNLVVNAGEPRGFIHCVVKFGTGLFNGTLSVDKMLLRVAERELEMTKSGNNPKVLIGIKSGL